MAKMSKIVKTRYLHYLGKHYNDGIKFYDRFIILDYVKVPYDDETGNKND